MRRIFKGGYNNTQGLTAGGYDSRAAIYYLSAASDQGNHIIIIWPL